MMQVLPMWKVTVRFAQRETVEFWVSDRFVSNVLRKVADLQFSERGFDEPTEVMIGQRSEVPQTGDAVDPVLTSSR